jgi:hypothetical protein
MWELRPTVEPNEVMAENLEVHNDFFALLISRGICWGNPVISN